MKKLVFWLVCCLVSGQWLAAQTAKSDTIRLYYLGGQSNMDGYGYVKDLPEDLKKPFENVFIFHGKSAADDELGGGTGLWTKLQPGHGTGFTSDGKKNTYSDRFGVELTLAKKLTEMYPNQKIAFVKYSRAGSSIDTLAASYFGCWDPDFRGKTGLNQYDHFLATLRNATKVSDINGDGTPDILVPCGIFWMQGESDATDEQIALRYLPHLKRLMDLIRASMLTDDLPVVIGKISDSGNDETDGKRWDYGELVQYAQEKFARTDGHAAIVRSTSGYKYSDPWHYDSAGYIDLGERFAEAILGL